MLKFDTFKDFWDAVVARAVSLVEWRGAPMEVRLAAASQALTKVKPFAWEAWRAGQTAGVPVWAPGACDQCRRPAATCGCVKLPEVLPA